MDPHKIHIKVVYPEENPGNHQSELEIEPGYTISQIKQILTADSKLNFDHHGLTFLPPGPLGEYGQQENAVVATRIDTNPHRTAHECGIRDGITLFVVYMPVNVRVTFRKLHSATDIVMDVAPNHGIDQIKEYLEHLVQLGPAEQRLVFEGVVLQDIKIVMEYKIRTGSVIEVIPCEEDSWNEN